MMFYLFTFINKDKYMFCFCTTVHKITTHLTTDPQLEMLWPVVYNSRKEAQPCFTIQFSFTLFIDLLIPVHKFFGHLLDINCSATYTIVSTRGVTYRTQEESCCGCSLKYFV